MDDAGFIRAGEGEDVVLCHCVEERGPVVGGEPGERSPRNENWSRLRKELWCLADMSRWSHDQNHLLIRHCLDMKVVRVALLRSRASNVDTLKNSYCI